MSALTCPRCQAAITSPSDANGWFGCTACGHRWFPSAAVVDSVPTEEVANPASGSRLAAPVPRNVGTSDEYLPDEPGSEILAKKALTERHDGQRSGLNPVIRDAVQGNARVETETAPPEYPKDRPRSPVVPSSPGRSASPPADPARPVGSISSQRPALANDPALGPTMDTQLFDRLEQDAQQRRSKLKTAPDLAFGDDPQSATDRPGSDHAGACPVCGAAVSTTAKGKRRGCAQCGTVFDAATGEPVSNDANEQDPLVGRTLRGNLIDRKLGEGGMGSVYHARQLSLDRSVAVKVLPVDLGRNKNFIQRFEREAKSLARINHPNILQIYDFGEDPQLGIYFMVIEYVEGLDLGEVINRRGLLGQLEVLDMLRQALQGLEAAAEKGVIHRDIKPDNLMIGTNGLVKVSDFGLAKGYVAQVGVTAAGVRVGTPAFMSPEQCDGTEVDSRSDVYNLGASAFLCLTGRLPFDGDSPFAIMLKHKTEPCPSLCAIDPNIDPKVDALIRQTMEKKPENRCDNLRELIERVEDLEAELAGTDSVLRKSRGPFKALVQAARSTPEIPLVSEPVVADSGFDSALRDPGAGSAANPVLPPPPGRPGSGSRAAASTMPQTEVEPESLRPPVRMRSAQGPLPTPVPRQRTTPAAPTRGTPALPPVAGPAASPAAPPSEPAEPIASFNRLPPAQAATGQGSSGLYQGVGSTSSSLLRAAGAPAVLPSDDDLPPQAPIAPSGSQRAITASRLEAQRQSRARLEALRMGQLVGPDPLLEEARERGRRSAIETLAGNAERLLAEGQFVEAAREFDAAAEAVGTGADAEAFRRRAKRARGRAGARRTLRRSVVGALVALVLVGAAYAAVPPLHQLVAKHRLGVVREGLASVTSLTQQANELKAFARETVPFEWYRAAFRREYALPAVGEALALASDLERQASAARPHEIIPPLDTRVTDALAADQQLPWNEVQARTEAFLATVTPVHAKEAGVVRARQLLDQAKSEQAKAASTIAAIQQAWATGDHDQALTLAEQVRQQHQRVPAVLGALPNPGRVRVIAPGLSLPADLVLRVDGQPVALKPDGRSESGEPMAQARIARQPQRETIVDVSATGFAPAKVALPVNATDRPLDIELKAQPLWNLRAGAGTQAWGRLNLVSGGLLVHLRENLLRVRPQDGAVLATAPKGSQLPGYGRGDLGVVGNRLLIPREDGSVQGFPVDLSVPGEDVHVGKGEVVAWTDTEFTLRPGHRLRVVVEDLGPTAQVVAIDGRTTLWTYQALKGDLPPALLRHDDRLIAIDDTGLHLLEEDGRCAGVFALPGRRLGAIKELDPLGNRRQIMIPTSNGLARLVFGGHLDPVRSLADKPLSELGNGAVVGTSGDFLLAGQGRLSLFTIAVKTQRRWAVNLTHPLAQLPALGRDAVATVTDQGDLLLHDRATGAVRRRIVHGTPLIGAPLLTENPALVVVLDRNGVVAAYRR